MERDMTTTTTTTTKEECCMCGDHGLSEQLFRCRICFSRFQHRYCSNLYPRAGTYKVCNWCLNKQGSEIERTQSSSSSMSFSHYRSIKDSQQGVKKKRIKTSDVSSMKVSKAQVSSPYKKQRVHSDESSERKKSAPYTSQETLRRTKSEVIVKDVGVMKQVFRGKVRRYKLLEEVSVQ